MVPAWWQAADIQSPLLVDTASLCLCVSALCCDVQYMIHGAHDIAGALEEIYAAPLQQTNTYSAGASTTHTQAYILTHTHTYIPKRIQVPSFRMIERHYFRNKLLKSFDFTLGFCMPKSRNTWEVCLSVYLSLCCRLGLFSVFVSCICLSVWNMCPVA